MTPTTDVDDPPELPKEVVSAWATVLIDLHERDQREQSANTPPVTEDPSCPAT
jgi:hypothetical protein